MNSQETSVPKALRNAFVLHFVADLVFAIPLFVSPVAFLSLMGFTVVDPITARMVAAALFGIGIESLLCRNAAAPVFKTMLDLKIIWSLFAIIGLSWALFTGLFGIIMVGVGFLATFVMFNFMWVYFRVKLR